MFSDCLFNGLADAIASRYWKNKCIRKLITGGRGHARYVRGGAPVGNLMQITAPMQLVVIEKASGTELAPI